MNDTKISETKNENKKVEVYYFKKSALQCEEPRALILGLSVSTRSNVKIPEGLFWAFWQKLPVTFEKSERIGDMLEETFAKLNLGGNPMATKENQDWIRRNNVSHTSMSVGDIIKVGDRLFITKGIGFAGLKLTEDY